MKTTESFDIWTSELVLRILDPIPVLWVELNVPVADPARTWTVKNFYPKFSLQTWTISRQDQSQNFWSKIFSKFQILNGQNSNFQIPNGQKSKSITVDFILKLCTRSKAYPKDHDGTDRQLFLF